jgi:hypothetical protein
MPFSSLPLEIRWMLWELVDDPRTIELRVQNAPIHHYEQAQYSRIRFYRDDRSTIPRITVSRGTIPLVLQTCQESREHGLARYDRLSHGDTFAGYFNFTVDTLFIPPSLFPCLGYFSPRTSFPFLAFTQLQHLAIYFPTSSNYPLSIPNTIQKPQSAVSVYRMTRNLRELRTITYISAKTVTIEFQEQFMAMWPPSQVKIEFQVLDSNTYDNSAERCLHMHNVYLCRSCSLPLGHRDIDPMALYRLGN